MTKNRGLLPVFLLTILLLVAVGVVAQETTGGLQGTVKDPTGAVVANAQVTLTGVALVGSKALTTDSSGYYRFANLPPGAYTITVKAKGFNILKQEGLEIQVGHLPTMDLTLKVGGEGVVVEVTSTAPVIDVSTTHTLTNVTEEQISDIPKGRSFQSVIQMAPAARAEPLQSASGTANAYQIAGGANSENAYLVEGQDTQGIYAGGSQANMPFEFISEVQVKTSGVEAEYSGAMGGVVNAVQKRGTNAWHGGVFLSYEPDYMDAGPRADEVRYDPASSNTATQDAVAQIYQPKQDKYAFLQPGFTIGGPLLNNRIWMFLGAAPEIDNLKRTVNFNRPTNPLLINTFEQNTQTYYTQMRVDAALTSSIRVFASYLYQYQTQQGDTLPHADSVNGLLNVSTGNKLTTFEHALGYVAPNNVFNVGMDYAISPKVVATTRFGHFFYNYGDRGWPSNTVDRWRAAGGTAFDLLGNSLAGTSLDQTSGYYSSPIQQISYTNAFKHDQFSQDVAFFKGGWGGTHNFKFGYQLNHLYNNVNQTFNGPYVNIRPGQAHATAGTIGETNCAAIAAHNLATYLVSGGDATSCQGYYGVLYIEDFSTFGNVSSFNHGLYAQDAWTIGKGLTITAGIRTDKESIPPYSGLKTLFPGDVFDFSFADKLAPRVGAAWDVFKNGRLKVFGSYGKFFDMMKLDVITQSFGGAYWHNCFYALDTLNLQSIVPVYTNSHDCTGLGEASFQGGSTPSGIRFIENLNYRDSAGEGIDPHLKPYQQHEIVVGGDYQLAKDWAFELRWDSRRLDRAVEDAGAYDAFGNEGFNIVNPGYGINQYSCVGCPANVKAVRDYDGVEFRVTKSMSHHWQAQMSYTWSRLWGNYSGLTNSDLSDSGGGAGLSTGRADPNNNRAFDEAWFMYDAYGKGVFGPLATDRPHTFKAYGYYQLPWNKRNTTSLGLFQQIYSGTPMSSYLDVGPSSDPMEESVYLEGRGKWIPATQDPGTGLWTFGAPYSRRTAMFTQTDFNFVHEFKVNRDNERQTLGFEANITNLLNQNTVLATYSMMDSYLGQQPLSPCTAVTANCTGPGAPDPAPNDYLHGYNYKSLINAQGVTLSSQYGKPLLYQTNRAIRLKIRFNF